MNENMQEKLASSASTRTGDIHFHYQFVEKRPFSRFAIDKEEIAANKAWIKRADRWGNKHFDAHGNRIAELSPKPLEPLEDK